jgi:DNA-binding MarR family transcriptional regulator
MDDTTISVLRYAIAVLGRALNANAAGVGLTPTQASVLGLVAGRGPLRPGDLARLEGLNPTMLSRVVGKLVDQGLVDRRTDPDDPRAALVAVTPAGTTLHEELRSLRSITMSGYLAALADEDRERLEAAVPVLGTLADMIRGDSRQPPRG